MKTELNQLELALLAELEVAHLILSNVLTVMTHDQKFALSVVNAEMDLIEEGITRASEREAVIKLAHAKVTGAAA